LVGACVAALFGSGNGSLVFNVVACCCRCFWF
jgi:hypothetical protein